VLDPDQNAPAGRGPLLDGKVEVQAADVVQALAEAQVELVTGAGNRVVGDETLQLGFVCLAVRPTSSRSSAP